jgi:4-amino-4-deoxy-L-arabinose transferase
MDFHSGLKQDMKKWYLTAIGIFVFLYIVPLGIRPIIIPDESRYAEIPREMIASGNWIVPKLNGLRYFEKPVLGYWLNALSIELFGEDAFAVRFPSAMATGLSAFIIFLLIRRFSGELIAGISAALIFLTSFIVYGIGTFNILDSILDMFVTASMASFFFAHAAASAKKKQGFLLLFGIFCGLAFLTKGFLAFAIPVLVIVPFMIWERRFKEFILMSWIPIAGAVLTALPWVILIHLKAPDFWHFFIWNEHIRRFLSSGAQHHESIWYYTYLFPAAALPWTFFFPAAIMGLKKKGIKASMTRYAICWFFFPFLFFSISKGKILTYILPCFPPFAILMSFGINKYLETEGKKVFSIAAMSLAILAVTLSAALITIQIVGFEGFKPYSQAWKWTLGVTGLMMLAFLLIIAARVWDHKTKFIFVVSAPLLLLFFSNFIMPDMTIEHKSPGAFLLRHKDKIKTNTLLVADEDPMGAVCWFYKRSNVYLLGGGGELSYGLKYEDAKHRSLNLEEFKDLIIKSAGKEQVVLVAKSDKYTRWKQRLPEPVYEDSSGKGGFVFVQY